MFLTNFHVTNCPDSPMISILSVSHTDRRARNGPTRGVLPEWTKHLSCNQWNHIYSKSSTDPKPADALTPYYNMILLSDVLLE